MSRLFRSRWLAGSLVAASCSLLYSGCADIASERASAVLPTVRLFTLPSDGTTENVQFGVVPVLPGKTPEIPATPAAPIVPVAFQPAQPEQLLDLPTPRTVADEDKAIPVTLDTVLRLAEEHNVQVAIARARLNESETEQRLAVKAWLPKVYAGMAYYRHEGGIQNEDGSLQHSSMHNIYPAMDLRAEMDLRELIFQRVSAERKAWQQRGELSKVTSETLLEAATTYLDLLTARRGEAVARELEKYLLSVQDWAEKTVTPSDRSALVLVEGVRAEVSGRKQAMAKLHQQGDGASAKLAYLLGVGTCAKMVPAEETLTAIDLVDPTPPLCDLITRALANGPSVRELQSMLAAMQAGFDRSTGPIRLLPTMQMTMGEGPYGAGPGSRMSFDNRWDMAVQVRWNLLEFATANEKRHLAESRIDQARLTLDDVRGKLTAGVQEARDASLSGREEIRHSAEQIRHAAESYRLSDERLKMRAPNASAAEVLQAIRGLETAHYNYLTAINAYNKAQIRLLVLLGPTAAK